jgi:iron uptake system component EfeO
MRNATLRTLVAVLATFAGAGTLVACGSDSSGTGGAAAGGSGSVAGSTAATTGPAGGTVDVTVTDTGCTAAPASVPAGPVTFKVTNKNAAAVSEVELLLDERILGEKENLAPGFSASFSLKLGGGHYIVYCPGAAAERSDFTVTGAALDSAGSTASLLEKGAAGYAVYVEQQSRLLVGAVARLATAIRAGHLDPARRAYAAARPYYERIEPVAESFTSGKVNLDARIDARAGDVPARSWTGFHVIERALFSGGDRTRLLPSALGLQHDVAELHRLTKGLTYQPAELLNGAGGLLDEVSKSKITGEEERYSHIDLLDFSANVEGAEQAFANVRPGLDRVDPSLSGEIASRFRSIAELLDHYRDAHAVGGFVPYERLTDADKRKMSAAVLAVKEPLSSAAAKVAAAS